MKKFFKNTIFLFLLSFFFSGCDQLYKTEDSDFFYIENKGALFPVMVSGNQASRTYIIFLSGGPGLSSFDYHNAAIIRALEKEYAFVYWDQRGSGSAQGNSGEEYLTLEQFTEDTEKIVDAISAKYNNPSIFLLGHSWGGCLGTSYTLEAERQNKIKGWIEVNGAHDFLTANELSSQAVQVYAQDKVTKGENGEEWQAVLDWYTANPLPFNLEQTAKHGEFTYKAFGSLTDGETSTTDGFTNQYFSPSHFTQFLGNFSFLQKRMDFVSINLVPQMGQITLPSLIVWGELDPDFPVAQAQQAYDALGTPEADKFLCYLPHSGHNPVDRDAELFQKSLITFINKYK